MNKISGYDLAQEIISRRGEDAIETILRYAGDAESDYLELKAAVLARTEDLQPGEQPEDMYWNIAKELIAMMNTRGGLLVIGVDDKKHTAVPLKGKDGNLIEEKDIEEYTRNVIEANIVPRSQKWTYKGMTYFVPTSKNLNDYLKIHKLKYLGETVIAYLVAPCVKDDFITVKVRWANGQDAPEILPRRLKGHVGKCEPLSNVADIISHIQTREIQDSILGAKLADLLLAPNRSRLDSLPERNAEFFGRERELDKIYELIVNEKIPILHGEAGTGKTELACEFAHRHKGRFPGGCIFIDMENVHSWTTTLNTIYSDPNVKQILGNIPIPVQGGEKDRASWIFKRLIANLERGNILAILDNMEDETALTYNELKKGYLAEYLKGPRRVCIIGTSRNIRPGFGSGGRELAEVVEIGNLEPEAAGKLLSVRLPKGIVDDQESKKYISQITQELGNHAWSTEMLGGYLSKIFNCLEPPPLASFLKMIQREKSSIEATESPWRGNAMTVEELLKPTIEQLEKSEGEVGKRAIELAKCIAFFPHEGVTEDPLRFVWGNMRIPKTVGIDEFKRSLNLLKQYSLIGSTMSDGRIRMHRLTQKFFQRIARKKPSSYKKFTNWLSKIIASDPRCPPRFWAEMAKDNVLMSHCPWDALDGSASHDIVAANPRDFADKIDWRKLDGYDIADLLIKYPELAKRIKSFEVLYHDDSESPCKAFVLLLAGRPDPFASKCDFSRLSCRDVVYLLAHQPQLALRCEPAIRNFNSKDWSSLLSQQPNLLRDNPALEKACHWELFEDADWMRILARNPELASDKRFTERHSLKRFSTFKWAYLLAHNPARFINHPDCPREKICESTRATILILSKHPDLAAKKSRGEGLTLNFNFDKLSPLQWAKLLCVQPCLSEFCENSGGWSRLNGKDWSMLLAAQPQFNGRCDFSKFDGNDWGTLLVKQPQLASPEAWKSMEKQPHDEFLSPLVRVIYNHPELIANQKRDLSSLSTSGKRMLLSILPNLDGQIDVKHFQPREWARLVSALPSYAEHCPFEEINPVELAVILNDQPQLENSIKDSVSEEKWIQTKKLCDQKSRAQLLSDLLWHFDDARMTCNLKKLIITSVNLSWTYFTLGLARQSKFYLEFLLKCLKKCGQPPHIDVPTIPVTNPAFAVTSLSSMLDLLDPDFKPCEISPESISGMHVFVRRFKKTNSAKKCLAALTKAAGASKLKLKIHDGTDVSSPKTRKCIDSLKKDGIMTICLNFEERMPFSFADQKKKKAIASFHDEWRFLDKNRPENLGFDRLITISPMLLCNMPADAGKRILQAIAKQPSEQ